MKKFFLLLFLVPTVSFGGTLSCVGTVESIGFHSNDTIRLKLSSMNQKVSICNTKSDWVVPGAPAGHQNSADTCKAFLSVFMAAKVTKQTVDVQFDGDDVPANCDEWSAWVKVHIRQFTF